MALNRIIDRDMTPPILVRRAFSVGDMSMGTAWMLAAVLAMLLISAGLLNEVA